MDEYPISRGYADAAVQTIYAGRNESMKVIIAERMGLGSLLSRESLASFKMRLRPTLPVEPSEFEDR